MVMGDLPSETEILVIGGGPGGYAAAFRAADLGHDVTIVSDDPRPGGVCLLRGCIPSKTLLSMAELVRMARDAGSRGVAFGEPEIDLEKLGAWRDDVVDRLTGGLEDLCDARGVRFAEGRVRLTGPNEARIEGGDIGSIRFEHAIIATGSRPAALPDTQFGEGSRIMGSTGALALPDIPQRLLVVGAGYVGLELGQVYARLGSEVTLVEATDSILPGVDRDLVAPLAEALEADFAEMRFETEIDALDEDDKSVEVTLSGDSEKDEKARFDRVLVAVGRRPNSDDLGLEEAGVAVDDDGFVTVDEQQRTSVENIHAIGDITGGMQLAHEAMAEGKAAAEAIAGKAAAFDARGVPAVIYTDPQIAWSGLTESEIDDDKTCEVVRIPWKSSGRAMTIGGENGMTKLVVERADGRIRGMGVVGHDAEALIAEGVLAIEMGAVAEDLARMVHAHPTLSETIGEAAEMYMGLPIHLPPPGKDNGED